MRALLTGSRGTVGRVLAARLRAVGIEVVGWDRENVGIDHYAAMDDYVARIAPDVVYNLAILSQPTGRANEAWLVNYEWPSELAWICRQRGVRFVHASTVMVFSDRARGPFTLQSTPDAWAGYGHEKRCAEERVLHQNPEATVVRLGWQIGDEAGSNNMLDYFARQMNDHQRVDASARFFPACSFLTDSADALARLASSPSGLYMIDANVGWSFLEIARALSAKHGDRWKIAEALEPAQDQRMIDPRLAVPPLSMHLPTLGTATAPLPA